MVPEHTLQNGLILPGRIAPTSAETSQEVVLCPDLTNFRETLPPFIRKILRTMGGGALVSCEINTDPNFPDQPAREAFFAAFAEISGQDFSRVSEQQTSPDGPVFHTGQYL